MADAGYLPSEIDRFTLADVSLIYDQWGKYPPVRIAVGAYLGIKPRSAQAASHATTSIAALRAQFPDGMMRG